MNQKLLLTPSQIELTNPQNFPWSEYKQKIKSVLFDKQNPWWINESSAFFDEQDMVNKIGNKGMPFHPVVLDGKGKSASNVLGTALLALDFDNEGKNDSTPKKRNLLQYIDKQCKRYQIEYLCAYQSFSYKKSFEKIRVLIKLPFYMDFPEYIEIWNWLWRYLNIVFEGHLDLNSQKITQPFFGGKGILKYNPGSIFDITGSIKSFQNYWLVHRRISQKEYNSKFDSILNISFEPTMLRRSVSVDFLFENNTENQISLLDSQYVNISQLCENISKLSIVCQKHESCRSLYYIIETAKIRKIDEVDSMFVYNNAFNIIKVHSVHSISKTKKQTKKNGGAILDRMNDAVELMSVSAQTDNKKYLKLYQISKEYLVNHCKIFHNVFNHQYMNYNSRIFASMTFSQIKGGKKWMNYYLNSDNIISKAKNKIDFSTLAKRNYNPPLCKNGCTYFDTCTLAQQYDGKFNPVFTLKQKSHQQITRLEEDGLTVSLNTFRNKLQDELSKIFSRITSQHSPTNDIFLIQSPPGSGKTHQVLQQLAQIGSLRPLRAVKIAFPTHDLKEETFVAFRGIYGGNSTIAQSMKAPSLPKAYSKDWQRMNQLEGRGLFGLYRKVLKDGNISKDKRLEIQNYFKNIKQVDQANIQFITHKKLMRETTDKDCLTIIDESIESELIKTQSISISNLRNFKKKLINITNSAKQKKLLVNEFLNRLELIEQNLLNNLQQSFDPLRNPLRLILSDDQIYSLIDTFKMDQALYALLSCDFYTYSKDESIRCITICKDKFPEGPVILLSSTLNEMLYRRLFSERNINKIELPNIQNIGEVQLISDRTYSKADIQKDLKLHEKNLLEFCNKQEIDRIITFKDFIQEQNGVKCFNGNSKLPCYRNFGDVEGYNEMTGRNLVVFGKYSVNPQLIKEVAFALNLDINEKDFIQRHCYVTYNGFGFNLFTYAHKELRALHLHYINQGLEQAVGRARTLTEKCRVYLFSNFPLRGVNLNKNIIKEEINDELFNSEK